MSQNISGKFSEALSQTKQKRRKRRYIIDTELYGDAEASPIGTANRRN
jgi:hypothetical protein